MKFCKAHGLGNDFIIIAEEQSDQDILYSRIAPRLCDRHTGIGADGILLVSPSKTADFYMSVINSDGSSAQMCGNGIRCAALFAFKNGIVQKTAMAVDTPAGIKRIELNPGLGENSGTVCVDMGIPDFDTSSFGAEVGLQQLIRYPVTLENRSLELSSVWTGVPHTVVFYDDFTMEDFEHFGPMIEKYPVFTEGTNVDFARILSVNQLEMHTWERGAGMTLACGTGACAAAAVYQKLTGEHGPCLVKLPLGDLSIELIDGHLMMRGPAVIVGYGVFEPDDFIAE